MERRELNQSLPSFSGDWATAPQLAANSILTKDAGEFLSVCRQSEEQARKDLSSAPNVPKVAGVPDLRVVVAFDVSYRRHVDQKLYHSSIGAFLSEPPYRMFLQRNYTSTNFSPAIQDLLNH